MKSPRDYIRVSPQGEAMGKSSARPAELGHELLKDADLAGLNLPMIRNEMCKACACRPGTVPNGCLQTQLDFMKAVVEGRPFLCHSPKDGRMCAGWVMVRAELVANPLPPQAVALIDQWGYTPPDEATP